MSVTQFMASVPMVRAPASWPFVAVAGVAMVLLAVIDFVGSVAAKQWSATGSGRWLALGLGCFLLLFYVYASSLRYADLALVTMGWIVLLQVGLLMLDQMRYGVTLAPDKWVAIGLILVLQTYLVVPPPTPS